MLYRRVTWSVPVTTGEIAYQILIRDFSWHDDYNLRIVQSRYYISLLCQCDDCTRWVQQTLHRCKLIRQGSLMFGLYLPNPFLTG